MEEIVTAVGGIVAEVEAGAVVTVGCPAAAEVGGLVFIIRLDEGVRGEIGVDRAADGSEFVGDGEGVHDGWWGRAWMHIVLLRSSS